MEAHCWLDLEILESKRKRQHEEHLIVHSDETLSHDWLSNLIFDLLYYLNVNNWKPDPKSISVVSLCLIVISTYSVNQN